MSKNFTRYLLIFLLAFGIGLKRTSAQGIAYRNDSLLYWGQELLKNINPQNTTYQHKNNVVIWGNTSATTQCIADCSGFINALVEKTAHWSEQTLRANLDSKRPLAFHYVNAINSGQYFTKIVNIKDVLPGDVIALAYADRSEHEDNSGHIMLVVALPQVHTPSKVLEPNSNQYAVDVIDCTTSGHGKLDTRYGSAYTGLGKGTFRLYTDLQGNIIGYSWSTDNPKPGFDPYANPVAVGRLNQ